jgi:hypothetical protein
MKREKLNQFEVQRDNIELGRMVLRIKEFFYKSCKNMAKSISQICTSKDGRMEKFLRVRDDPNYIKYMRFRVWSHDEILNLYFLYLNPIFVMSAYSLGW